MKATILILLATVSLAFGRTVQFTGIITSVLDTTLPVHVGDTFHATAFFNTSTHAITHTNITVGILHFSYPAEGTSFTYQDDPCHCSVSYQVSQSNPRSHLTLQLFGVTNDSCTFPSLDQFALNEWTFYLNGQTIGKLTEIPVIQ